jgi:large subunit ribosomal protein L27
MSKTKGGGSTRNGRDSHAKRLGVKVYDGTVVQAGAIIVRQRGMTFLAGPGTDLGGDYTLFATTAGNVKFEHARKDKKRVRVIPAEIEAAKPA